MVEVLAVYEGWLGAEHPNALICRLNVATALCLEKRYADALPVERAANGLSDALGPIIRTRCRAKLVWASVLAHLGKLEEDAAELEERSWPSGLSGSGPEHPDTLRCQANLLLTRHQQGANGQATERQQVIAS